MQLKSASVFFIKFVDSQQHACFTLKDEMNEEGFDIAEEIKQTTFRVTRCGELIGRKVSEESTQGGYGLPEVESFS